MKLLDAPAGAKVYMHMPWPDGSTYATLRKIDGFYWQLDTAEGAHVCLSVACNVTPYGNGHYQVTDALHHGSVVTP
jgi:hypothetical protein